MSSIRLAGIDKSYGTTKVLHGIDIDIEDGEFCVFVGPSGCGKSTLLRVVAGLETITAGDLFIGGQRVNQMTPPERGIAMVFQSYALYPHMSVYKNMAFGLKMGRTGKAEADRRVREAARTLALEELLDRRPAQLSGGQRQRVAIGRAIVREPKVFLFDEPLSNLDAALRVQTRIEIARLHRTLKSTVIYVTHDQVEAMTLADKIVVLNCGEVAQVGAPLELYHRPQNRFVAGFIGSPKMNFIDGQIAAVDAGTLLVELAGGDRVTLPAVPGNASVGDRVTLGIRPEHLHERETGEVALRGSAAAVERLGDVSYVYLDRADGGQVIAATRGSSRVQAGAPVNVRADAAAMHLFDAHGNAFERHSDEPYYDPD